MGYTSPTHVTNDAPGVAMGFRCHPLRHFVVGCLGFAWTHSPSFRCRRAFGAGINPLLTDLNARDWDVHVSNCGKAIVVLYKVLVM